ncbi:MAG: AMP-binding protein [Lachnospiraceae bacterium]|nr:AMP-binding protein [Lachnospiraceae bacterium]
MSYFDELKKYKDKMALISEEGISLTYDELSREVEEIASLMQPRSLMFSFCTNTAGSVCGYLGALNRRVVPYLLDAHTNEVLVDSLIQVYQPAWLYLPQELKERYPEYETVREKFGYALLRTGFSTAYPLHEDLALLLGTSGSTGSPKLVRQSYRNIQSNAEAIAQYLELDDTERPVTTLPMNYTYGLSIINSHLLVGAAILLTTKPIVGKEFWDFMKTNKATSFGGVPYTYEMLKRVRFFRMDLPDLRTMTQAGGKLAPELHREFAQYAQEKGKRFIVMYGQTEATARMSWLPYDKSLEKYGSMGIAIPGGRFSLIDVDGNEIQEPEVTGELVYEGPNVTLGYAQCGEDLAKGDERHGRLETGDMAKRDADGFYYVVGRKKRFLKLFGNRINLDEIDRMIKAQFDYLDCATTGTDECMEVYITDASCKDDVKDFLIDRTHINASAIHVNVIKAIPKNEAGKTLYIELGKEENK